MEFNKEKREITLERELSDLDKLVLRYIEILSKHVDYVIISGYVSILLGRSRSTEDVDVFIKKMSEGSC
jgi:RecA-family ATPase